MCKEVEQKSQKCCKNPEKFCDGSLCSLWRRGFFVTESGVVIGEVGGEKIGMCAAGGQ